MIHAVCDVCGKDCDRGATLLSLTPMGGPILVDVQNILQESHTVQVQVLGQI